jgi:sensor histidine kinase regulating citrate/malate metabolism
MKHRNFIIMMAIGMIGFLMSTVSAHSPMPDSIRAEHRMTMLKDRLKLTDAQSVQIRSILENEQKSEMADREKHQGDLRAMQKIREERRQETDKQIIKVLNKDQQTEFDKMQKEMRKRPPTGDQVKVKSGDGPRSERKGSSGPEGGAPPQAPGSGK